MNTATGGMNEASMFEGGEVTSLREHSWLLFKITCASRESAFADNLLLFLHAIH